MGKLQKWGEIDTSTSMNSGKYNESYDQLKFPKKKYVTVRIVGDAALLRLHWIPVLTKEGGRKSFPLLCRKNLDENEYCPCCDAGLRLAREILSNVIVRDLQEGKPSKVKAPPADAEFMSVDFDCWNPVQVMRLPITAGQQIQTLAELNKVNFKNKGPVTKGLDDPKYGRDINIYFDPSASVGNQYQISPGNRTPLDEEETAYLLYDLERVFAFVPDQDSMLKDIRSAFDKGLFEDPENKEKFDIHAIRKVVKSGLSAKGKAAVDDEGEDDDDDSNDITSSLPNMPRKALLVFIKEKGWKLKNSEEMDKQDLVDFIVEKLNEEAAKSKKKSSKVVEDDEDEYLDDDITDEDDESEDDDPPAKTKPKGGKSKPKSKPKDEEEDESDEDEFEDEDDDPPAKTKPKSGKPKPKSKPKLDEDEYADADSFDEDEDEGEDEDEEPPAKTKPKSGKPKPKSKNEEPDEDEFEDEDEDEDDDPPAKTKPKSGKSKPKPKSKPKDEEPDEDEFDDDTEDDEDEEPPAKSKPKAGKNKPKAPVEDDDEPEDDYVDDEDLSEDSMEDDEYDESEDFDDSEDDDPPAKSKPKGGKPKPKKK